MIKRNIVLIGFMGTGKTAVGKQVAMELGYEFLDTDDLIEQRLGLEIPAIFQNFGQAYFRKLESEMAMELAEVEQKVISTGGGFPLNPDNLTELRKKGFVVLLVAEAEVIFERIQGQNNRPLLRTEDPLARIRELLQERKESYSNADFVLETTTGDLNELSRKVIAEWQRRGFDDGTDQSKSS